MNLWHNLDWVLPLRTPALTQLAMALSWLGYSTFILFFMSIGYWTFNRAIFYRLMVLVVINAVLNAYAKDWIQDPRPPLEIRLDDRVGASYGLPSGHAQMAVVLWMWLAWELRRAWVWVLCAGIAVAVILSRLYLGVHDLEDVVGGAALGGLSLVVFEAVRYRQWRWQTDLLWATALVAAVTLAALASWRGHAPEYIPTLAGWLVAASWCLRWDQKYLHLVMPNTFARRVGVALLGAALFLVEQKALKWLGTQQTLPPQGWALVKGLINGVFVTLVVPCAMQAIKLARANPLTTPPAPPLSHP
jgi:membrane-associated phospholipid phosphatase